MRKTWLLRIFDFWFWEFLGGEKLEKILQKSPQISFFSAFSADLDEILYKIGFWSPKTKSEDKF